MATCALFIEGEEVLSVAFALGGKSSDSPGDRTVQ